MSERLTRVEHRHHGQALVKCPVCGGAAEMWEAVNDGGVATKAVMCSNGDPIGPLTNGCPLYLPPFDFYHSRYVDAAVFWNDVAAELDCRRDLP